MGEGAVSTTLPASGLPTWHEVGSWVRAGPRVMVTFLEPRKVLQEAPRPLGP